MSPLPGIDPWTGDVVYTEALLRQPPPGVTYVRYDDALRSGELHEHGRRRALEVGRLVTERSLGPRWFVSMR